MNCQGFLASCLICLGAALPDPCSAQEGVPDNGSRSFREQVRERWLARQPARAARSSAADGRITGPGDYSLSLVHAGLTRWYRLHVPLSYSPSTPAPLVFSFHGGGGSMDYQANDSYYGQISKSEQAGYIAVFPNGFSKLKSGKLATWNAGNCCASARDEDIDDVGFVRAIIAQLGTLLNIDRGRIFANGMSNGGMMAYRLACEMSDVFKAVAAVAGTDNTRMCSPKAPISILHIHARDDELELFEGGAGRQSSKVTSFVSVPDSIARWVKFNACSSAPKRVFENAGAYCDAYLQCRGAVEVRLCVTASGGHSWPGGKKPRGDTPPSTALAATDVIWEFFVGQQH